VLSQKLASGPGRQPRKPIRNKAFYDPDSIPGESMKNGQSQTRKRDDENTLGFRQGEGEEPLVAQ